MQKTIVNDDYKKFIECLRDVRQKSGLTQVELAQRIGESQSFVSKCERGERRMDVSETRAFLRAMGESIVDFILKWERSCA